MALTILCNHCGERVIARAGEPCPMCRRVIEGEAPDRAEEAAPRAKPGGLRAWLARRMLTLAMVGLALGIYGLLGSTFQRRGRGSIVEGPELVWIGLALMVVGTVLHLILRVRRKDPR